ncbi:MAG: Zn-ribbon containing protein [Candidatus Nanoarchaeia archaeon]|nr:Zn-ribbon containing protein [Candidatus Nanoarchaeia archaeon]
MPHQCVRCGKLYVDGSADILKGCSSCGGRFFFFVKENDLKKAEEITVNLSVEDKDQIVKDVMDIIGIDDMDKPVILDLESIRILEPGKYELDVVELFKGKPLVYRLEDGKYIIDIASTFESSKKKQN